MDIVQFLIKKGAKVEQETKTGESALWIASQVCFCPFFYYEMFLNLQQHSCLKLAHLDVVEFLVEKGANLNHANNDGKTPLWVASSVCCHYYFFCKRKRRGEIIIL